MTKISDFPYDIYDQTKISIPYLSPLPADTVALDIICLCLVDNDEDGSFVCKADTTHTLFKSKIAKSMLDLFMTKTAEKRDPLRPCKPI